MIDGGSSFVALWSVLLVLISLPGIVSVGIYTFMLAWNKFFVCADVDQDHRHAHVPVGIQLLMGEHPTNGMK
jgi:multiple sugar transport system permease protein